ncbi:MAG: hypothetical protein BWK73_25500 [Thiothrix lacustris]|uniref:DNA-directed DNA polymerase family A palm domain-containing protein n=1 Tax=Thiothrix lacustris TaxID=525917 RepID=A0A1Y1QLT9_9GAMM|nr:MAG: hypothetical protein BWK73_25500 [Thiothrix lacustris]
MTTLWIDTETYNEQSIKAGLYRYAEHPSLEILIYTYAIDDGAVQLWDTAVGDMPADLHAALHDPTVMKRAWNAQFDREVMRAKGVVVPIEQWCCVMVKALAHGLPASLAECGEVLGLSEDQAKLSDGKKLIKRFCSPTPANYKVRRYSKLTHPDEWARFCEYAKQDITAMRELDKRIPNWNFPGAYGKNSEVAMQELQLWHLDQHINRRGFAVDMALVQAGITATARDKDFMRTRFVELTQGMVKAPSQRAQFMEHLNTYYSLGLVDTQSATFQGLLESKADIHPVARELMEISIGANKSSTAKFVTMVGAVCADGSFRGGLQFNGAQRTRRWAGRIFQPQNLPSRIAPRIAAMISNYISSLKSHTDDILFDPKDRAQLGAASLRGLVVARPEKTLRVCDLSNIEGRLAAWFAGAQWKLNAFAAYDAGTGADLYRIAVSNITGQKPEDVSKTLRNGLGKPAELGLGYQGGVDALRKMLGNSRMYDYWDAIVAAVPEKYIQQAEDNYDKWGAARTELDADEWIACETVKLAWRATNPEIVKLWYDLERAMANAIESPGKAFDAGKLLKYASVTHAGFKWLLCQLPSGRKICYFEPRVTATHSGDGRVKKSLSYMGNDSTDGRKVWTRRAMHGGLAFGNVCQTTAGDLLKAAMPAIHREMPIILTVHDEVLAEDSLGLDEERVARLRDLMIKDPGWAEGLPLNAEGETMSRYRK